MESNSKIKQKTKFIHKLFLITNGLNFIYGLGILVVFSYFVAKNKFQDSFTITTIFLLCLYSLICIIGNLWTKKTLFLNYFYGVFLTILYCILLIFKWTIVINIDSLKEMIIGIFTNSDDSANLLIEIIKENIDVYKISIAIITLFMVRNNNFNL